MEEREDVFTEEMLLPSLDEAAAVFRAEGARTELSFGNGGVPTIFLHDTSRQISLSCALTDTDTDAAVFRYTLTSQGDPPWSFPALDPPTTLPAFPYLLRLYDCLTFGMAEDTDRDAEETFRRERLAALQDTMSTLGLTSALVEKEDPSEDGIHTFLTLYTEEGEILFTYDFIFPALSLAALHIVCGGEHIFLPERGEPRTAEELALLLPLLF